VLVVWTAEDAPHPCVPRCMQPKLENARKDIWDQPDENGRKGQCPKSVGRLPGESKWEKPLANWTMATGVGFLGPENGNSEAERVERAIRLKLIFF
jgi:hypothetical protein